MTSSFAAFALAVRAATRRFTGGPQLLFNTTMIAAEHDAAGRHLGDESFTLSPLYCGSTSVGYASTENLTDAGSVQPNLWLGPTAALAGSAAEPAVSAPLRRSRRCLAPAPARGWRSPRWSDGPQPARESATCPWRRRPALMTGDGDFLYLTGGVQFERLGVYELIRRRCRFIIAVDGRRAGESPGAHLAHLITRCRSDFGIRIEIDRPSSGPAGPGRAQTTAVASPAGSIMKTSTREHRRASLFM